MNLTTLSHVKSLLGRTPTEDSDDYTLGALIEAASAQAERYLNRGVVQKRRTEYHDLYDDQRSVQLFAYPVATIAGTGEGVWSDSAWSYATASLIASTSYVVDDHGILHFKYRLAASGPRALKVIYTGGMAPSEEKIVARYPDISEAIARQVLYLFNTRKHVGEGLEGVSPAGGWVRGDVGWLTGVKAVLDLYRNGAH